MYSSTLIIFVCLTQKLIKNEKRNKYFFFTVFMYGHMVPTLCYRFVALRSPREIKKIGE